MSTLSFSKNLPTIPRIPSVAGWKELPIQESGEPLVPIGPFSSYPNLYTSSIYYGQHRHSPYNTINGSLLTLFVREKVAQRLSEAQTSLPTGCRIIVFDAYRSYDVQLSLFNQYVNGLKKLHPNWNEQQLMNETQKYVSYPSNDQTKPAPHNTGGAVDLALIQLPSQIDKEVQSLCIQLTSLDNPYSAEAKRLTLRMDQLIRYNSQLLNFGTRFDHGGKEAALRYLEEQKSFWKRDARGNRRLLSSLMEQVGMERYGEEWWHYNAPETQMGAQTAGKACATYAGIELTTDLQIHEDFRKAVTQELYGEYGEAIRFTHFPRAAMIAPSKNRVKSLIEQPKEKITVLVPQRIQIGRGR